MPDQNKPTLMLNKAVEEAKKPSGELVTYLPGPEDPVSTKWRGYTLHANVPKMVTNTDMIEQAKLNRFFHVGPFDPAKDSVKVAEQSPGPKNSDQYRSYAVEWFKITKTVDEFDSRWIAEEKLREQCGVGTDDIDYLMSLYQPRRAELRKMSSPT